MSDPNLNESYNSLLQNSSFFLKNTDGQKLNEAKLMEMFFVKTSMLISNSKSLYFLNHNEDDPDKHNNPDKIIIDNTSTFHTKYLENEQNISPWRDIDVERLYESHQSKTSKFPPPLVIETYLDLINLEPNQNLYIIKKDSNQDSQSSLPNITGSAIDSDTLANSILVCKGGKKNEIVLERWLLELDFEDSTPDALHFNTFDNEDEQDLSLEEFVNNKFLIFLRYLESLLRMLPSQELHEKAYNEEEAGKFPAVRVSTRILDGSKPILSKGRIGLSKPLGTTSQNHLEQKSVSPLETDLGLLRVNVSYRQNVNFFVLTQQEISQILSSKQADGEASGNINMQKLSPNINNHNSIDSVSSVLSNDPIRSNGSRKSLNGNNRGSIQYQSNMKVGSVGSIVSTSLTRNPSNSSVIANMRVHRSGTSPANNGLSQTYQNHASSESLTSQNQEHGIYQSIGSVLSENKPAIQHESLFKRPLHSNNSINSINIQSSISNERKFSRGSLKNDGQKNSSEVDEFLSLISDDTSLVKDSRNQTDKEFSGSITDSIYKFREMKMEDSKATEGSLSKSNTGNRYVDALANYRNMSSSSILNSRKNSDSKDNFDDKESPVNQYGLSPTRGFDAENLRAVLSKSRRASMESSKRIMISNSKNSLYSHTDDDKIDANDKRKDAGSLSSVSSPRDIITFKNMDSLSRRRSSASSMYSIPKFSHSLNNDNRYSGSPGSNFAHSLSSNITSRKASLDNVSLAIADTSAVYADFEKPKSILHKNNTSSPTTVITNSPKRKTTKVISEDNEQKKSQHSSYNDDDLLFFMGDSN